jgi:hypothetical protein
LVVEAQLWKVRLQALSWTGEVVLQFESNVTALIAARVDG